MTVYRLTKIAAWGTLCCLVMPLSAQQSKIPPRTRGGLVPPIINPTFPEVPRDGWLRSISLEKDGRTVESEQTRAIQANILRALPGDISAYTLGRITETAQAAAKGWCCKITLGVEWKGVKGSITLEPK